MITNPELLWNDASWQEKAQTWIREESEKNSIQLIGDIEQPHIRHWSTVMAVESEEGKLFFKATAPELIHEIALTEKLAMWYPEDMAELIAVDVERGWLLMHDGGKELRKFIRPTKDIQLWEPVIHRYAALQIGLAEYLDEMLNTGIPDHRLTVLPSLFAELLTDEKSLMLGLEKGLNDEEYRLCQEHKSRFSNICAELVSIGIPETINHGDFHDGNVLVKNGHITFFDWGDADITHPFISLRTFFVSIEMSLELDDYEFTPEMEVLLDIYLNSFKEFASKKELRKAFALSKPVASLITTLKWRESIARMTEPMRAEHDWIVPEVLREFLYRMNEIKEI